jgi:hypothetical protein
VQNAGISRQILGAAVACDLRHFQTNLTFYFLAPLERSQWMDAKLGWICLKVLQVAYGIVPNLLKAQKIKQNLKSNIK